jgi:SAM-dependent methyltransferase
MAGCPACGMTAGQTARAAVTSAHVDYTALACGVCGLWYSDPMRYPGMVWYSTSPIYSRRHEDAAGPTTRQHAPFRPDWRHRAFASLQLSPGTSLLDVGCGDGSFLEWALRRGFDAFGVDVDPSAVSLTQRRVGEARAWQASAEECAAAEADREYGVICLFDVMEHLARPVEVLRGLARRLAPNGALVWTVPSHQRWPAWFAADVDSPPHHLTLWSSDSVRRAAERAGLRSDVRRSPLLAEHLIDQTASRFTPLRSGTLAARLVLAVLSLAVAPATSAVLRRLRPDAGGFTLFVVSRPPSPATTFDRQ